MHFSNAFPKFYKHYSNAFLSPKSIKINTLGTNVTGGFNVINKLDEALTDLTEMTLDAIKEAKEKKHFSKDFIEAACIVLSMSYGRFGDDK